MPRRRAAGHVLAVVLLLLSDSAASFAARPGVLSAGSPLPASVSARSDDGTPPAPPAPPAPQVAAPSLRTRLETAQTRPGLHTATVEWDAGGFRSIDVRVSRNGGPPQLFAAGPRGTAQADWIELSSSYVFQLYDRDTHEIIASAPIGGGGTPESLAAASMIFGVLAGLGWLLVTLLRHAWPHGPAWRTVFLATGVIWLATAFLIHPTGEFPLNDDWAYAWSVRELLRGTGLRWSDWGAVNLLPQILWGALFSAPAGFSFFSLRLSIAVAGLIAIYAGVWYVRQAGASPAWGVLAGLTLAFNPIFLALSYSFNSDVPSLMLFAAALYAVSRGLAGSDRWFAAGVALSVVALLERQTNLVLFPASAAAYVVARGVRTRPVLVAVLVIVCGAAVQFAYATWLQGTGRAPLLYGLQMRELLETLRRPPLAVARLYATNAAVFGVYLGLFLLPILLIVYGRFWSLVRPAVRVRSLIAISGVIGTGFVWLGDRRMPLAGNILERAGIGGGGPSAVAGYSDVLGIQGNAAVHDVWTVLTVLGLAGVAILAGAVIRNLRVAAHDPAWRSQFVFAMAVLILLIAGVGGVPPDMWFDRYLLAFLPVGAALAIGPDAAMTAVPRWAVVASVAALLLFGVFSVTATHDLIAAGRARWDLYDDMLRADAATPADIGEWGVNGWYLGQRIEDCNPNFRRGVSRVAGWTDFVCLDELDQRRFMAASVPLGGRVIRAGGPYARWLPPTWQRVYIIERPARVSSE
jgi:hypothetical protein